MPLFDVACNIHMYVCVRREDYYLSLPYDYDLKNDPVYDQRRSTYNRLGDMGFCWPEPTTRVGSFSWYSRHYVTYLFAYYRRPLELDIVDLTKTVSLVQHFYAIAKMIIVQNLRFVLIWLIGHICIICRHILIFAKNYIIKLNYTTIYSNDY